ncbi:sodium-dependent phosphate transporter 1-A-like, partial [Tropilaelaps mercedesae]
GFSIEIGSATTVLAASHFGLPISTTHCKVGSIVLVGSFSRDTSVVDWTLFKGIAVAWLGTLPITAGFSAVIMVGLQAVHGFV